MRRISAPHNQSSLDRAARVRRASASWRRLAVCLSLLLVGAMPGIGAADEPEIRVGASAEEIYSGEGVEFHVEIRNSKNPSAPDMSSIKELFDVVSNGDESRNQSSIFIINGRKSEQNIFSHVYRFHLTPKQSGDLTIPSVKATIDGKTLTSTPLPLRVITPEEQDHVILEIKTSRQRVYPTQPFTVTLRVLVQPLPNDNKLDPLTPLRQQPPHLQLNWVDPIPGLSTDDKVRWLQPLLAEDGVGFSVNEFTRPGAFFDASRAAAFKLYKERESREGLDGSRIRYFAYELTRTFTPEKTGEYTFGPAIVKGLFVSGTKRNEYTGKRLVAISEPKTVEVLEVPAPRPATFCGGIGDFRVSASASPTKLRVGDPLTLTLELERGAQSGSLELVSAPDLSAISQLTDDFDLIDKNPTGRVEGPVKKFAYAMRPRRSNVSIPALTVSTFDPTTEQFVDSVTSAIPLEVSEASRLTAGDLVGSLPTTGNADIKTRAQGIYQNIVDPTEVRDERLDLAMWGATTAAAWCLSGCIMAIVTIYRRKSSDVGWQRRQQARRAANRELAKARAALTKGQEKESQRHVRSAIVGFIADMRNRVADGLTVADVAEALTEASVPAPHCDAVVQLLESIESAEYGGSQSSDPSNAIETAGLLIGQLAPHLEKGA